jgi:hypothetical protein
MGRAPCSLGCTCTPLSRARPAGDDQGDRTRRGVLGSERDRRFVGARKAAPLEAVALRRCSLAWGVTSPVRRGVYVLELRVREGGRVISSNEWLLRVFAHGTQSRPLFREPKEVAAWWARRVHPGGSLVAIRRWHLSVGDLRDPRRHQKLVIAYTPPWPQRRQRPYWSVRHSGTHEPPRSVEAARSRRRAVAADETRRAESLERRARPVGVRIELSPLRQSERGP